MCVLKYVKCAYINICCRYRKGQRNKNVIKVVKASAVSLSVKNKTTREGAISLGGTAWRCGVG